MGTEKFFVFNENGTLKRLKGRIVRFLHNEDPDNDDKVAIRASLSVPAVAEGLTPANNLSDVSSAETSRNNLAVPSDDELARSIGSHSVGPAVNFDGSDDYVQIADADALSFTDGSDDLPFSFAAWIKMRNAVNFRIVSKWTSSQEWQFSTQSSGKLKLAVEDSGGDQADITKDTALTDYEDQWIHVVGTYGGSGPNSATAFTAAADEMNLYINGESVTSESTRTTNATYGGMSNTSQAVQIGRLSSVYADGEMRDIKIFNREISAAEVETLYREGQLGFADEWGEENGGSHVSDFSAGVDGWSASGGAVAGNIDGIGGEDDTLRFTIDGSSGTHDARLGAVTTAGAMYRVTALVYMPSTNSHIDGISIRNGSSASNEFVRAEGMAQDSWVSLRGELEAKTTSVRLYGLDSASDSFQDAGSDDVFYVKNITITQIGTVADFRAENFDTSEDLWRDASDNDFDGTNNGATLVGARKHLSAEKLSLTNLPTSSAGLSAGSLWNDSGTLKIV